MVSGFLFTLAFHEKVPDYAIFEKNMLKNPHFLNGLIRDATYAGSDLTPPFSMFAI